MPACWSFKRKTGVWRLHGNRKSRNARLIDWEQLQAILSWKEEQLPKNLLEVKRTSHRVMSQKVAVGDVVLHLAVVVPPR